MKRYRDNIDMRKPDRLKKGALPGGIIFYGKYSRDL